MQGTIHPKTIPMIIPFSPKGKGQTWLPGPMLTHLDITYPSNRLIFGTLFFLLHSKGKSSEKRLPQTRESNDQKSCQDISGACLTAPHKETEGYIRK